MRNVFASLTSRLVLVTVALVAVVTILVAGATTLVLQNYLQEQLDSKVQDSFHRAAAYGGPLSPAPVPPSSAEDPDGPDVDDARGQGVGTVTAQWYTGYHPTGSLLVTRTSGKGGLAPLTDDQLTALQQVPADGQPHTVNVPGLGSYRVVAAIGDNGARLAVGLPTSDLDDTLSSLVGWEVVLVFLAMVVAGAAGALVVRRQLRPLREVAATAHSVAALPLASGEIELAERVPDRLTDERTEVGQVGAALNTLLAHVESSLHARHESEQQVRQFVADASHELRTPLTTIAGYTELARRRSDDAETVGTALGKVEAESARMTALVEDLLLLARLDSGRPLERRPVDLSRMLVEAVSDARVVAPDHRWQLELPEESIEVTGDVQRLHQVVTNLLTNARKYTPSGTTVTVTGTAHGFSVHDDGPGFPPGLALHAFERFARGDASRTRGTEGGAGLGLALVQAIVTAHGGSVSLDSHPGSTLVTVTLSSG
jgi:two-component system, OmpR family, sensor kinase